jgi:four helix bundle protein
MTGFTDFRQLVAWQRAREVRLLAYKLLKQPGARNDFKFRDQLSDASRSATRNIAEGFARYRHKEFAQFVRVAQGSMAEVLDHFIDAVDNGYLAESDFPHHEHACRRAMKAINGLIKYLETTPDPPKRSRKRAPP